VSISWKKGPTAKMKIRLKEGGGRGNEMGDIKSCHHFISITTWLSN
jgi:hypothetical protein